MDAANLTTDAEHNQNDSSTSSKFYIEIFRGLGKVLNEVGIIGFIVLSIVIFIFLFATPGQKSEIIDCWLLFKGGNENFILVTIVLLIIVFSQQIHYKKAISMRDEKISELSNKKNSAYAKQLGQKLSSSIKAKKT